VAGRERGERIESEDLGRRVYRVLKAMIIDGELPAGEKLAQQKLAARLGVSRTPLLAAFSRLEQESLVRTVPRRGAFVRSYRREELLHIYDIRCRLEPLGARGAALAASPSDLAALRGLLADFDTAAAAGDDHALKRADFAFHMELMRCSGNGFLYDMLSTFNIIIIANTTGLLKPAAQSDREHHELLAALEARDPERAERIMFEHLSGARSNLLSRVGAGREG
jgi:DNA-binding GntR family transcriptional regulator